MVKKYIDKIVQLGKQEDMEELSNMFSDIICGTGYNIRLHIENVFPYSTQASYYMESHIEASILSSLYYIPSL